MVRAPVDFLYGQVTKGTLALTDNKFSLVMSCRSDEEYAYGDEIVELSW